MKVTIAFLCWISWGWSLSLITWRWNWRLNIMAQEYSQENPNTRNTWDYKTTLLEPVYSELEHVVLFVHMSYSGYILHHLWWAKLPQSLVSVPRGGQGLEKDNEAMQDFLIGREPDICKDTQGKKQKIIVTAEQLAASNSTFLNQDHRGWINSVSFKSNQSNVMIREEKIWSTRCLKSRCRLLSMHNQTALGTNLIHRHIAYIILS